MVIFHLFKRIEIITQGYLDHFAKSENLKLIIIIIIILTSDILPTRYDKIWGNELVNPRSDIMIIR